MPIRHLQLKVVQRFPPIIEEVLNGSSGHFKSDSYSRRYTQGKLKDAGD